jgi:hypothetical protein
VRGATYFIVGLNRQPVALANRQHLGAECKDPTPETIVVQDTSLRQSYRSATKHRKVMKFNQDLGSSA